MSDFKKSDAILLSAVLAAWLAEGKSTDEITVLSTFFISLGNNLEILSGEIETEIIEPLPTPLSIKNKHSRKV